MTPPPPKSLLVFSVQALLLCGLIGVWPTPRDAYPSFFHAQANALFACLGAGELRLETPPGDDSQADTRLSRVRLDGPVWQSEFDVDRIGYWPAAALVALLLATPLTPLQRAGALLVGLTLLDVMTLGRIGVEVAYLDYELALGPGLPAQGIGHLLLRSGSEALTATVPSVAFVLGCWVAVSRPHRKLETGFAAPAHRS